MAGVNGFKFKLVIQATIRCSTDSQIHKSILPLLIQSNLASEKRYLKIVVLLVPCLIDVHLVWIDIGWHVQCCQGSKNGIKREKEKRHLILRSEGSWLAFSPLKKELEGQSTTFPAQNTFSAFAAALVIRKSETHPFRRTRFFWHDESKVILGNLEGWRRAC